MADPPKPESRVALFLSVDIIMTMASLSLVTLRVVYRKVKGTINISDYLICLAMFCALVHLILDIVITVNWGYARHQADLPIELRGAWQTNLIFWLIQLFTKFPLMFSKLSLGMVYQSLLSTADTTLVRWSRIVNWITIFIVTGFFTSATFVGIFACNPVNKSWFPKEAGTCIDTTIMFNYITSSINILTSVLIIGIPLPVLFKTAAGNKKIEIKQLIGLVLLGLVDTIISCIRLYMIGDLRNVKTDFTWIVIPTHIVIVLEFNVTIIAACLVVMRPCFQAIFNRMFPNSRHNTSNNTSHDLTGRYAGRNGGYIMSSHKDDMRSKVNRSRMDRSKMDSSGTDSPPDLGITKTVDIELSSRGLSTEDILRSRDRF